MNNTFKEWAVKGVLLGGLLLCSGCSVMDEQVYVRGVVLNGHGEMMPGAEVALLGHKKKVGENGCFYFGGVHPSIDLDFHVERQGFKPLNDVVPFHPYWVAVTMFEESEGQASFAEWRVISESEMYKEVVCKE